MRWAFVVATLSACGYSPTPATTPGDPDAAIDAKPPIDTPADAWLDPWTHRKSITIHGTKITAPAGGLIDFPVEIALDDSEINNVALASGADLAFTTDDATTRLSSEIELVQGNEIVAWVKLPMLATGVDTKVFIYYGNSMTLPSTDPEGVWSASFGAVWHLSQDPGPGVANDIRDATANHHHGQAEASMATGDRKPGQVGDGFEFDGTANFINIPTQIDAGDGFTLSAWVNPSGGNNIKTVFSNSLSGLDKDGFRLFLNSGGTQDHRILFETSNGTTADLAVTATDAIADDNWTLISAVVDRTAGTARLFKNGVDITVDDTIRNDFENVANCELARMGDIFRWEGQLDEIELALVKRPAEWLLTSFVNQNDAPAFIQVGSEETKP